MYWVYVLECPRDRSWYIGYTADLADRLRAHKSGYGSQTTSIKSGWELMYCEGYRDKRDALGRERFLKSGSGRRYIKK